MIRTTKRNTKKTNYEKTSPQNKRRGLLLRQGLLRQRRLFSNHRRYIYLDSSGVYISILTLSRTYPNLVARKSAQDLYGLENV